MKLFENEHLFIYKRKYIEMYKYHQEHTLKETSKLFHISQAFISDICAELSDLMNNYNHISKEDKIFFELLEDSKINKAIYYFNNNVDIMMITNLNELIFHLDKLINVRTIGKKTIDKIKQTLIDNGYNIHIKDKKITLFYKLISINSIKLSILKYNRLNNISKIRSLDDLYSKFNDNNFIIFYNYYYIEDHDIVKINDILIENGHNTKNMYVKKPIELLGALLSIIYEVKYDNKVIKIDEIIMKLKIKVFKPQKYDKLSIGSFIFVINNQKISFCFNFQLYNINEDESSILIEYQSDKGFNTTKFIISDIYNEFNYYYNILPDSITSEFLSNVEEIKECEPNIYSNIKFRIEDIIFTDDSDVEFIVNREVIDKFNNKYKMEEN